MSENCHYDEKLTVTSEIRKARGNTIGRGNNQTGKGHNFLLFFGKGGGERRVVSGPNVPLADCAWHTDSLRVTN